MNDGGWSRKAQARAPRPNSPATGWRRKTETNQPDETHGAITGSAEPKEQSYENQTQHRLCDGPDARRHRRRRLALRPGHDVRHHVSADRPRPRGRQADLSRGLASILA